MVDSLAEGASGRATAAEMRAATRTLYLAALSDAMARPVAGDMDGALHGFLTFNAAYFLGEWLAARTHASLVRRLARGLDGLAGLPIPNDRAHATQLAQHVRELVAEFPAEPGSESWLTKMMDHTQPLVPVDAEDWDAMLNVAARLPRVEDGGHALLLAHARRRLWELAHPAPSASPPRALPLRAMRASARAAVSADAHGIQVAEALLAEMASAPPPLVAVLRRALE